MELTSGLQTLVSFLPSAGNLVQKHMDLSNGAYKRNSVYKPLCVFLDR